MNELMKVVVIFILYFGIKKPTFTWTLVTDRDNTVAPLLTIWSEANDTSLLIFVIFAMPMCIHCVKKPLSTR